MKVLIIDHDPVKAQIIRSKLESLNYVVEHESIKDKAMERLAVGQYGIIFLDPSPLSGARSVVVNIRRTVNNYPYIFLVSDQTTQIEAITSGVNDLIEKPIAPTEIEDKIDNAVRLRRLISNIGNEAEDFPSAGGVIAKSAFNQLFLSAIERADRYGEKSYILFISLHNHREIIETDGPYPGDSAVAQLSQALVILRRQSDIIGQTSQNEYALLLQRPAYEAEPTEAAERFAAELSKSNVLRTTTSNPMEISIKLVELPTGIKVASYNFNVDNNE